MTAPAIPFVKGHGTENDFILIPDPDDVIELSAVAVRALCDRRSGIGADGVIRMAPGADGFVMDYRNADGSLAEMCGNGARVFARYLYSEGWAPAGPITLITRGGRRVAEATADGGIRVEMGRVRLGAAGETTVTLLDGTRRTLIGTSANVGNPHLVVDSPVTLPELDLTVPPVFDAAQFPAGVNIEFVSRTARPAGDPPPGDGMVAMRVYERGSGETRSCGTGTVAVAAMHLARNGRETGEVDVVVPGGAVRVRVEAGESTLTGPAVLVASGTINGGWWAAVG